MSRTAALILCVLLSSCARWTVKSYGANHHVPKFVYLYVAVSNQVAQADDNGAVLTMVETIEADLHEEGIRTELVAAHEGEPPPLPRVELQVVSSVGADREMRGAGKLAGLGLTPFTGALPAAFGGYMTVRSVEALGKIVVDCYVLPGKDGVPTFAGRIEQKWADEDSPEAVAHAIARAVLR